MTLKVALIGAGAMGGAIGARIVQTGQDLTVFDLDAQKVAALVALGAKAAPSAAQAAAAAYARGAAGGPDARVPGVEHQALP